LLTPRAGLLAAASVAPVAALALAASRVERARVLLRLPPPERRTVVGRGLLLALVALLLVLAAMQPAVRTHASVRARTDAEAFVVLDTSRSMLASHRPGGRTRLARAKRQALSLAATLQGVPLGVATFTDRVLPDLFPTADRGAFDSTVESVTIESPPPRDVGTTATSFDALSALATEGFFPPATRRRAVVLFTDGESRAFDPGTLAETLAGQGVHLAVVRVGDGADRVWRSDGKAEAAYRPDPSGARESVARLRAATGGAADPAAAVREALGTGPTTVVGVEPRSRTLSPFVAVLALIPLLLVLGISPGWLRGVTSLKSKGTLSGS
jgi:hypothetical protein